MTLSFYLKKGWIITFIEHDNEQSIVNVDRDRRIVQVNNKLASAYSYSQVIHACNLQIDRNILS